ncbi:MAG TPA: DUF4124 domain-containing protein [Steroidobacteraceae bacterium]
MRPAPSCCLLAASLLALGAVAGAATVYRWVDAQGVVHYSDTPHPGAEQVQLSDAQTYHGPPAPPAAETPPPAAADTGGYQSCAITQPAPDAALYAPESVNVSVRSDPPLRAGDQFEVEVDGAPLQPVGDGHSYQISQPERGSHAISAVVRDASGAVVCNAEKITFYVQRPSVNTPTSPQKPH